MKDFNQILSKLPPLSIPEANLSFHCDKEGVKVFDILRKKFVAFTPEEYVRQSFVSWLINKFNYPASHMANEVFLKLNGTNKRCDTVVYDNTGRPNLLIEYKAPYIKISEDTINQIFRYNRVFNAKYLILSNGIYHLCCYLNPQNDKLEFLNSIPRYVEICDNLN